MKYHVGALAVLLSFAAGAGQIARQGDDWVRITSKPCTDEKVLAVIDAIEPDAKHEFVAATAMFNGQTRFRRVLTKLDRRCTSSTKTVIRGMFHWMT